MAHALPTCAVTITTRNRREELRRTCRVLSGLNPIPEEVLICSDGSTDGTAEMVRKEFPSFRLFENFPARGSVASRDFLIRQTRCDVVVSFDDDSHPIETNFFATLKACLVAHPEAAVISFGQRSDEYPDSLTQRDWGPGKYVASFANSGAALRRQVYLRLDGYPPFFFHMYEEPDYALQCYGAGYAVWFEPNLTVRHYYTSTGRRRQDSHVRHARNEQWSVWMRCPMPYLPLVAIFRAIRQMMFAFKRGFSWVLKEPLWWLETPLGRAECARRRKPIAWRAYLNWMKLARNPLYSKDEWQEQFI
jgi:GT2 family glycosyltransferase